MPLIGKNPSHKWAAHAPRVQEAPPSPHQDCTELKSGRAGMLISGFNRRIAFLCLVLVLAGCASTPHQELTLTGDILSDGPNAIANGPPRDRVLWQYRTAAAAMR